VPVYGISLDSCSVWLTFDNRVGGGGAGEARKEKLKAKNEKLAEERTKRTVQAEKETKDETEKAKEDEAQIHPSRRARMAVLGPNH
jgi:hypothetical protein